MSVICQTFVQNTWRSDLCSNCFKCLEEHSGGRAAPAPPRYMPQALYQSRGISSTLKWRLSEPIYERVARRDFASQTPPKNPDPPEQKSRGILIKEKKIRSRPSVDFASEEALVIGYGGNDYDSDQSPWEMASDDGSVDLDLLDDTDEDRKITRITRNNTEFNSFNKNLLDNAKNNNNSQLLRSSNNIKNNNNNSSPPKSSEKTLCNLTYNDIQPQKQEKKLNQYYFSSPTTTMEPLKSYLHNGSVNTNVSKKSPDNVKVENTKRIGNDNCRTLLSDNFSPLNTRTYSFVSEVNKNSILSSEHSSDSDYSTCRLTAGDSTDSESFQDAEDSRILPCSSFLHGNYPRGLSQPALNSLENDKKYDGGSSTSGDVSNLSDDSDCQERTPYRMRNVRVTSSKHSTVDTKVSSSKDSTDKKTTEATNPKFNEQDCNENSKTESEDNLYKAVQSNNDVSTKKSNESVKILAKNNDQKSNGSEDADESSAPDSLTSSGIESLTSEPDPNPPLDVNLHNIIAVSVHSANLQEERPVSCGPVIEKSLPLTKSEERGNSIHQKLNPKPSPPDQPRPKPVPEPSNDLPNFSKEPSDDDSYERSPEAINNRQSKLAALALELELARRDSAMRSAKSSPPILTAPPEIKTKIISTPSENYPIIKKNATSCMSRLASTNTLPEVQNETPVKTKKNRFSLKKLLKRNKDSGTFTPSGKEVNPKAWKKQSFDRNRLSLEIVHPMDLTVDPMTSGDSTPTEESHYMVSSHPGYSRARSLSALPQLSGEFQDCTLIDCRRVDTLPTRKAGTVAERKKNRPSLVRTPSCSALPNRPATTPAKDPPPKPPPPPKSKVMHPPPPPPPPHVPRISKPNVSSPARPPPPKIPEPRSRSESGDSSKPEARDPSHGDKEYANLGDIRSLLTPKKPQRPSALSGTRVDTEDRRPEDIDETEEEDHYTYLDEVKTSKSVCKESPPSTSQSTCSRPWLDLQTSYAAIAAANYESLAEIITSSVYGGGESFENGGKPLKWKDFVLESETPQVALQDKQIYNALYRPQEKQIMLLVTSRKQSTPQNARNLTRYPVLASFTDNLPKCHNPNPPSPYMDWASVYVLHRSAIATVQQFTESTSRDGGNQHIHLRNYCFVLLQLIHTLKTLQADGIEEVSCDWNRLVLVTTQEDKPPVFVLFPEDKTHLTLSDGRKTLCQATLSTMYHFLGIGRVEDLDSCNVNGERLVAPVAHTFKVIAKVLMEEKASSLTQAKGFLEYMLWGPVDVTECQNDLDTVLQRWLDLQRAQMVKSTISKLQNSRLHVYEEYQLVFLLQASIKSLKSVISKL
ncbi:uncharacterized protein TNCT_13381 [Trichonephila clavata]|uniref:Uncharacterized protein n=1 Tax=Trichonephila clavata TaxID=2740835 RepID=A0A8X6FIL6_TRICU|nr:uncharacterized protein TNCT_13381 [Trichonephila clavata]